MTAKVIYEGNLRTSATHIQSGNTIITDAPTDNRGKGETFSPTDLLATSLASCFMTIIGIKSADKNIDIEGMEAAVTKHMVSGPRKVSQVDITITMPSKNYSAEEKTIIEKAAIACPVSRSLSESLTMNLNIIWP